MLHTGDDLPVIPLGAVLVSIRISRKEISAGARSLAEKLKEPLYPQMSSTTRCREDAGVTTRSMRGTRSSPTNASSKQSGDGRDHHALGTTPGCSERKGPTLPVSDLSVRDGAGRMVNWWRGDHPVPEGPDDLSRLETRRHVGSICQVI
jgi:hypothetical protein